MPGTIAAHPGSWDIDGDTVVFARKHGAGDFTFYKWTVSAKAVPPEAFGQHLGAGDIADVRLHNGRMTYTYGAALDSVGVVMLHDGFGGLLAYDARDADLFHEMYAYEIIPDEDIDFRHNEFWQTTLGTTTYAEINPSVFGNRVAFERVVNNGDIILARSSEPLIDRTAGDTRYETVVAVSKRYFRSGADNVVLCTGEDFPDALSAAPWARFLKAPVLLTRRAAVPQTVMDEIDRLGAKNVWIIGGENAVSATVQTQLQAAGLTVDRQLQGTDRYATSAKIAMFLYDALAADGRPPGHTAFVARGDAFPDALAVAPVAAATYSPILLVRTQAPLPPAIDDVFEHLPIWFTYIAGGTDVVSEGVEEAIEARNTAHYGANSSATRMAGDDRYETSARVMQHAVSRGWLDLDTLGVATGLNFPDALGGGAALGTYGSPLVLTRPGTLPPKVADAITYRAHEIGRVDIFGGEDVVSDGVRTTIAGLLP
jgi:putative cell wall-binding protein